jgi:hypothetical protein
MEGLINMLAREHAVWDYSKQQTGIGKQDTCTKFGRRLETKQCF